MSIKKVRFQSAAKAFSFLDDLACNGTETFIFRGHSDEKYRLENTWQRDRKIPHEAWMSEIDETLTKYAVGLHKLGLATFDSKARFEALEHGRHHGVPTPCLDFSYSPYVALFFGFNGVRPKYGSNKNKYSVIYALNVNRLAAHWARIHSHLNDSSLNLETFMYPPKEALDNGFPANHLQFIPLPGSKNPRMQRQMGALLYDTLNYQALKLKDLEDYIDKIKEPGIQYGTMVEPWEPTLYKIYINQASTGNIFQRLELMNMTGGYLYGDANGVAMDIKNTHNYNPKSFYLRDVDLPDLDDTKM